jgi:two-component sensor histidine kinase
VPGLNNHENLVQSYPAIPASVPVARRELTEYALRAGASVEQLDAVRLACSEALTNVVVHAYGGYAGRIYVNAGLRSNYESSGLGVGLALIAQASDGLTIMNRGSGGTEVRMRFRLEAAQVRPEGQPDESSRSATRPASARFSTTT